MTEKTTAPDQRCAECGRYKSTEDRLCLTCQHEIMAERQERQLERWLDKHGGR